MFAVMLKPGWPGVFHRSVRDKKGEVVGRVAFAHGDPQILSELEYASVKADIGISLVYADLDSDGIPTGKAAADQSGPAKPRTKKRKDETPAE